MAYIATIHNSSYTIELERQDHQANVRLDGRECSVDLHQLASLASEEGGRFSLLIENISYDVFARRLPSSKDQARTIYEIIINNECFEVGVEDERVHLLAGLAQSDEGTASARVQAPMPGRVVDIPVTVGQIVQQGQTVAILEAMKMENDLPAPLSGTVHEIYVQKGQTVDQGSVLVVIARHQE